MGHPTYRTRKWDCPLASTTTGPDRTDLMELLRTAKEVDYRRVGRRELPPEGGLLLVRQLVQACSHGTINPTHSLVVSDAAQPGKDHGRRVPDMRPTKGAIALSTRTVASLRLQRTQPPSR